MLGKDRVAMGGVGRWFCVASEEILRCAQDDSVCYHVGVSCVTQNISRYFDQQTSISYVRVHNF